MTDAASEMSVMEQIIPAEPGLSVWELNRDATGTWSAVGRNRLIAWKVSVVSWPDSGMDDEGADARCIPLVAGAMIDAPGVGVLYAVGNSDFVETTTCGFSAHSIVELCSIITAREALERKLAQAGEKARRAGERILTAGYGEDNVTD